MNSQSNTSDQNPPVASAPAVNDYIQPTLSHGLRIWWAYFWRNTVVATILYAAATLIIKPLLLKGDLTFETYRILTAVSPWLLTYSVSIPVIYFILRKRFQHFRIGLFALNAGIATEEVPPTLPRTLRVWWTFTWRTVVYRLILGFAGSVVLDVALGFLSATFPRLQGTFTLLMSVIVEAAVGLFVIYSNILDEDFSNFRVSLLPRSASVRAAAPAPAAAIPPAAT
jgi:hypothetical protein